MRGYHHRWGWAEDEDGGYLTCLFSRKGFFVPAAELQEHGIEFCMGCGMRFEEVIKDQFYDMFLAVT